MNEEIVSIEHPTSLAQIRRRFKPDADVLVYNGFPVSTEKAESTIVVDGSTVVLIRRGQIPLMHELEALMMARHTPGVHERMKNAVVGIAGAGGLGSHVAMALARVGIGTLVIADFDVVEPSNLNRQVFTVDQIGEPKVEALKDNTLKANPFVTVQPHCVRLTAGNIAGIFTDVNILVEALDVPREKVMLVNVFSKHFPRIPVVMASGVAGYAPSNWIKTARVGEFLYVVGDMKTAAEEGQGLMAPRVGVAAHHQANQVIRLILGQTEQDGAGDGDTE